mgnify:CR=1 FL=1|tara:strand:+ start:320 stop:679 length:360 start_codon:yes stop_codon:yes gene_type:complete
MNKDLFYLFFYMIVGNILAWFQLQGQFWKSSSLQHYFQKDWIVVLFGVPIGWMFWKAATHSYQYFGGVWNIRLIGFGVGTVIFGIMTMVLLRELPGWHTVVSIVLAATIIMLQFANLSN